jgi:hypothetical protein
VGISRVASATSILLIAKRLHNNGVIKRACIHFPINQQNPPPALWPDFSIPLRDASKGFMSKISMPCIFPRISNRSKPVACSRSVGTVPVAAPGGIRSCSLLISVPHQHISPYTLLKPIPSNFLILDSLAPLAGVGAASPGKRVSRERAMGERGKLILRTKEVVKLRFTIGPTAARRAVVKTRRRRDMVAFN